MCQAKDPLFSDWVLLFDIGEVVVFLARLLGLNVPPEPADWGDKSACTKFYHAQKKLIEKIDTTLKQLSDGIGWQAMSARVALLTDRPYWLNPFLEQLENRERAQPPRWAELLERLQDNKRLLGKLKFLAGRYCQGAVRNDLVDTLVEEVYDFVRRNARHWYRIRGSEPANSWWGWLKCDLPTKVKRRAAHPRPRTPGFRPARRPAGEPGQPTPPDTPSPVDRPGSIVSITGLTLPDERTPRPDAHLLKQEFRDLLARVLSQRELAIFEGHVLDGLTFAELAANLNKTPKQVVSLFRRLRSRVKRFLLKHYPDDFEGWAKK